MLKSLLRQLCVRCTRITQIKNYSKPLHQVPLVNTLTGRFVDYLNKENEEKKENKEKQQHKNNTANILDKFLNDVSNNNDITLIMSTIDKECCLKLPDMKPRDIFKYLNFYMTIVPNQITKYEFYKASIAYLSKEIINLSVCETVKYTFYIGLVKKTKNSQKLMRTCLNRLTLDDLTINELNIEDLLIICNSSFKTSTVLNKTILDKIVSTINENLYILNDAAAFITFVKTLRHNKYQNEEILNTITSTIFFNKTYRNYNFAALCHILILYVDHGFYDEQILELFSELCVEHLKCSKILDAKSHVVENNIRIKDLKNFMWAFSTLNYKLPENVLKNVIEPRIKDHIRNGDYENEPDTLIDTIFYLWVLEHKSYDLIRQTLTPEKVLKIRQTPSKGKIRLNMLLTCIKFEDYKFYKELDVKEEPFSFEIDLSLRNRAQLSRVYEALKAIMEDLQVNKITYEFQVPHLNIVGITGYRKNIYKSFYVEVLDEATAVKNKSSHGNGTMQLKLRILSNQDPALIVLSAEDIETMDNYELQEHLKSEISLTSC